MKTRLFLGIGLLSLLFSGCATGGETNPPEPSHEHTYSSEWSHDETYHWHAATCEHTSEVKDKGTHTFEEWIVDIEATEYKVGSKHKVCNKCEYRVDATINKLEHTHKPGTPIEENRHEPTCTVDGSYDLVTYCRECGEEMSKEHIIIPPTGHQHTATRHENEISATCTESGSYDLVTYCTDDGVELSREHKTIDALGHDLVHHDAKAATCTESGWNAYDSCSRCSYSTMVEIPPTGHQHTVVREENRIEPTCTEDGSYDLVTYCTDDDTELSRIHKTIDALGHNLIHHNAKNPTCTEGGWEAYDTCSRCDYSTKLVIPEMGHNWGAPTYEWSDDYSTCTATRTCSNDSSHIEQETIHSTYVVVINPGYGTKGIGRYSAIFTNSVFETQNHDIDIEALECVTYVLNNDRKSYSAKAASSSIIGTVEIKNTYNDLPVTAIQAYGFRNCKSLTSINIPVNVTTINTAAFYGCSSLASVDLASGLTTISSDAFAGCTSLTSLLIPDGVKTIQGYAFYGCSSLLSINIPTSVLSIGQSTFYGCTSLESMTLPFIGESRGNGNYNFLGYMFGAGSYEYSNVPTTLKSIAITDYAVIPNYAFYNCSSIENIVFPSNLTTIGEYAFQGCTSLATMTIPDTVNTIGIGAFKGCRLESLTLPFIGESAVSNQTLCYLFGGNSYSLPTTLKTVNISDTCTSIPDYAFYDCNHLENINIGNSVTSIGNYAFYGCSSIASLIIPDSVTIIGIDSFYNCSSLTSLSIGKGLSSFGVRIFDGCSSLVALNISSDANVTSIGNYAFTNCSSLTSFTVPDSVKTIGNNAFLNCSSLETIIIPEGVKSIGENAFKGCFSLKSIIIPESVISLGKGIFEGCTSLESITIPFIGSSANSANGYLGYMFGASSESENSTFVPLTLKCVNFNGNKLTKIDTSAFAGCSSIEEINIPSEVTSIGTLAFYNCSSLKTIVIPDSVSTIGKGAFYGCSLDSITLPFIGESKSSNQKFGYIFTHPSSTIIDSATVPTIILSDKCTSIPETAFDYSGVSNLIIGKNVTSIGRFAFRHCSNLTSITYNGTVNQWDAITKTYMWNSYSSIQVIHCADGDVTL